MALHIFSYFQIDIGSPMVCRWIWLLVKKSCFLSPTLPRGSKTHNEFYKNHIQLQNMGDSFYNIFQWRFTLVFFLSQMALFLHVHLCLFFLFTSCNFKFCFYYWFFLQIKVFYVIFLVVFIEIAVIYPAWCFFQRVYFFKDNINFMAYIYIIYLKIWEIISFFCLF